MEAFLRDYKGSCIIISHDRYFLNSVCNRIFSIENKKLKTYNCGYDDFVTRREKEFEINRHLYEKQQKEISRQKEIIQRFENYGNNRFIKQASSRRKMLEKIDLVENPEIYKNSMKLKLVPEVESGKDVLSISDLTMGFSDKILLNSINLNVYKGDKIGLVGKNGVGKTTLFKIICNKLSPLSGSCDLGARVSLVYYEDLFKSVGELSGGERARLELLKLMLSKSNFLLLDEPTNHLDIESKEVLENAVVDYSGTLLTISHDRYFLNKVVNKIWYLEDGKITEYYGNYDYFLEKLNEKDKVEEKVISKTEIEKEKKKKREIEKQERAKKQKLKEIENQIFEIEDKIEKCNLDIQDPEVFNDKDRFLKISEDLSNLIKEKENLYLEWENYL